MISSILLFPLVVLFRPSIAAPTTIWSRSPLEKRFEPLCFPIQNSADAPGGRLTHLASARACRDQLAERGRRGEVCRTRAAYVPEVFCDLRPPGYARVTVTGFAIDAYSAESNCEHVAMGMDWIMNNCGEKHCECGVGGQNAAWGNGNLIITIRSEPE